MSKKAVEKKDLNLNEEVKDPFCDYVTKIKEFIWEVDATPKDSSAIVGEKEHTVAYNYWGGTDVVARVIDGQLKLYSLTTCKEIASFKNTFYNDSIFVGILVTQKNEKNEAVNTLVNYDVLRIKGVDLCDYEYRVRKLILDILSDVGLTFTPSLFDEEQVKKGGNTCILYDLDADFFGINKENLKVTPSLKLLNVI